MNRFWKNLVRNEPSHRWEHLHQAETDPNLKKVLWTQRDQVESGRIYPSLLAVSKGQPFSKVVSLYEEGQRHFGENYVQELLEKVEESKTLKDIKWHLIGPLQSNKIKMLPASLFAIHSIQNAKILRACLTAGQLKNTFFFLQVRVDTLDIHKSGFDWEELELLVQREPEWFEDQRWVGFMGIGPLLPQKPYVELYGEWVKKAQLFWKNRLRKSGNPAISLGMSSDFLDALDGGSHIVRLGSLIFGERVNPTPTKGAGPSQRASDTENS